MERFRFTYERKNEEDGNYYPDCIKTIEANYLPDILQSFEDFLKGCGFSLKGNLEIIELEEKE